MIRRLTTPAALAFVFALALAVIPSTASAQWADSWVNIGKGNPQAGANADGLFKFGKTKASSKNGVDFGHGFAVGAGPNGLTLSNSIGVGGGNAGAAHNVQLNLSRRGAHVSHGGVVTQGGNRRVIAGGHTGTRNGQAFGGSRVTGFGQNTRAYSKSRTRNWGGGRFGRRR